MIDGGILVVGGGGHIGLPLSLYLANRNMNVTILDVSHKTVDLVSQGIMPFHEPGCQKILSTVIETGELKIFSSLIYSTQKQWPVAIVIIGTQLLSTGQPDRKGVLNCIEEIHGHLSENALLILRSTVYPGTTELVRSFLKNIGRHDVKVIFAPERIAEGFALNELEVLPQIVGADSDADFESGKIFFELVGNRILRTTTKEAEFIKLTTNAYRFAHFALGNAIYLAAQRENLDYSNLMKTMMDDYPRLSSLPRSGYVGGPCLIKDTIQLQSYLGGSNSMTEFALSVNRELVDFTIRKIIQASDGVQKKRIGILGIAFKPESDDIRDSPILSVMKELQRVGYEVKYFDPMARTEFFDFEELEEILNNSNIIVIGTPHKQFADIKIRVPVISVWN